MNVEHGSREAAGRSHFSMEDRDVATVAAYRPDVDSAGWPN